MSRPALPLRTARLTLRPVEPGDVSFFQQLYADWRVAQYLLRTPAPFTDAHAQAFVEAAIAGLQQRDTYTLVMEHDAGKPVGLISLRIPAVDAGASSEERAEDEGLGILGYSILPEFWGQRYASESAVRMIHFAFDELGLDRIQASPLRTNTASCRLLERLGFTIVAANVMEEPLHGGPPQPGDCYLLRRAAMEPRIGAAVVRRESEFDDNEEERGV